MNYLVLKNKLSQKLQLDMIVSIEEIQKDDILKVKENINKLDKINIINDNDNIDIILLISESISSNFMSLYGYHNNNNYNLENELKNGNLIKFDNVFSTHTHTGRSLTNIFSKFDNSQKLNVPSYELKKYSLIDILKKANVFLKVFSNTELSGSTKKFYQNHFNKSDVLLNENNMMSIHFLKNNLKIV